MMNDLFWELINDRHVIVYMDDIMVFSVNMEEHRDMVKCVLVILCQNNLYLKPQKCEFERGSVEAEKRQGLPGERAVRAAPGGLAKPMGDQTDRGGPDQTSKAVATVS